MELIQPLQGEVQHLVFLSLSHKTPKRNERDLESLLGPTERDRQCRWESFLPMTKADFPLHKLKRFVTSTE